MSRRRPRSTSFGARASAPRLDGSPGASGRARDPIQKADPSCAAAPSEARVQRLLDEVLRSEVRGGRSGSIDVTAGVLRALGYRPLSPGERGLRRRSRGAFRLLVLTLLATAAVAGIAAHNRAPGVISVDHSVPSAVDRAVHSMLSIGR